MIFMTKFGKILEITKKFNLQASSYTLPFLYKTDFTSLSIRNIDSYKHPTLPINMRLLQIIHYFLVILFSKYKIMKSIQQRVTEIIQHLQENIYEKNTETALALLAALAGESILLLGPPGVAKSMIARRLKEAFRNAHSFEYLMSRFSTPDELFGPISINRLKEADKYERATSGYLPTADVVFLDEIWKAGPAIQNTLLTVMNEKIFRNGEHEEKIPLKLLIAASNELPANDEGLEALWDRFLIRIVSRCIQNEETFRTMLREDEDSVSTKENPHISPQLAITSAEYQKWQNEARKVTLSDDVLEGITWIRQALQNICLTASELPRRIYISDRRWKHIARLLRTSAFLQGRSSVSPADLYPMYHALWNEPEEINEVKRITLQAVFYKFQQKLNVLSQQIKADLHARHAQEALARAVRENDHRDDHLLIAHRYFYQLENHGTGHTYIYITDYKKMPMRHPFEKQGAYVRGMIYQDPRTRQRQVIRILDENLQQNRPEDSEIVTLYRDEQHLFINGVAYKMRQNGSALLNPTDGKIGPLFDTSPDAPKDDFLFASHYEDDMERLCESLDCQKAELESNIFISNDEQVIIQDYVKQLNKQIALTRVDLRKLLYDDK